MDATSQNLKGLRLNHRIVGNGSAPILLLLHGITGSYRYWSRAEADLAADYRLVMPDLIGFGGSPKPDVDYTIPLFVETLRRFLEEQDLVGGPIGVIGHSLGATVALEYLDRYPGAFDRMVAVSLPRHASREEAHRLFLANSINYRRILGVNDVQACLASIRESGPQVFLKYLTRFPAEVVRDSTKFTLRSLLTTLEYCLLDYRLDDLLSRLPDVPTLMLHGSRDKVAPLENAAGLAQRPGWRLKVIDSTGHHLLLTNPRDCLQEIRSFLQEHPASMRSGPGMPVGA